MENDTLRGLSDRRKVGDLARALMQISDGGYQGYGDGRRRRRIAPTIRSVL